MTLATAQVSRATSEVSTAVKLWGSLMSKLRRRLTARSVVDVWLAGLRAAGVDAHRAKEWAGRKYPTELPYVIELPCPYDHRTEDRRSTASVRLIVEDDGWVSFDPDSSCPTCNVDFLEAWLLLCPRCYDGDESPEHVRHGSNPLIQYLNASIRPGEPPGLIGSVAPIAFVLTEFERIRAVVEATWWMEHTEEASADYARVMELEAPPSQEFIEQQRRRAQHVLAADQSRAKTTRTKTTASSHPATDASRDDASSKPEWTPDSTVAWMKGQGFQQGLTVVAAWNLASAVDGHPPKRAIESGLSHWKSTS
jgi:hypothetical protein